MGSLRNLSKNVLNWGGGGGVKAKIVCRRGSGYRGCHHHHPYLSSHKNFDPTPVDTRFLYGRQVGHQIYRGNANKAYRFLNLRGLITQSFLAIWLPKYEILTREFIVKKCVFSC